MSESRLAHDADVEPEDVRRAIERNLLKEGTDYRVRPSILALYYLDDPNAEEQLARWGETVQLLAAVCQPDQHQLNTSHLPEADLARLPSEQARVFGEDIGIPFSPDGTLGWQVQNLQMAKRYGTLERAIAERWPRGTQPHRLPSRSPFDVQLHRLELLRFRGLPSLELDLRSPLTVLVGLNGAGKSTVLDALAFLAMSLEEGLASAVTREGPGLARIRTRGKDGPVGIHLSFAADIGDGVREGEYGIRIDDSLGRLSLEHERLQLDGDSGSVDWLVGRRAVAKVRLSDGSSRDVYGGADELKLGTLADGPEYAVPVGLRQALRSLVLVDRDPFFGVSEQHTYIQRRAHSSRRRFGTDPDDLLAACIQTTEDTERLARAIRAFLPSFDSLRRVVRETGERPTIEVYEHGSDVPARLDELSAGMRQMLLLGALYVHPAPPSTILLEEPDAALHGGVLAPLRDLLRSLSNRSTVIATSHRPELVRLLDPASEVQVLTQEENGPEVVPLSEAKHRRAWLRQFDPGEALQHLGSDT